MTIKVLNFIDNVKGAPAFLIEIDGNEWISWASVFAENTAENRFLVPMVHRLNREVEKLLSTRSPYCLAEAGEVTNMAAMFLEAKEFNHPLNHWDVSNVTCMREMFHYAHSFNQPLDKWDVSKVEDMAAMFTKATAFNQPLTSWNVSNVRDMAFMFKDARKFNQPLGNWDVSKVKDMHCMFYNASAFNRSLNKWNVSNVSNVVSAIGIFHNSGMKKMPSWYKH